MYCTYTIFVENIYEYIMKRNKKPRNGVKYSYGDKLNPMQKRFCRNYVANGFNASRAALDAGYSKGSYRITAHNNLKNPKILRYVDEIKDDLEKFTGLSKVTQILEYKKIAYASFIHFHDSWQSLKAFEELKLTHPEYLAAVEQIETRVDVAKGGKKTEYVKIKLYSKLKALDSINQLMGYLAPVQKAVSKKVDNTSTVVILPPNNR